MPTLRDGGAFLKGAGVEVHRAIVKRRRRAMGQLFEQVLNEVGACLVEALPSGDGPPELTAG